MNTNEIACFQNWQVLFVKGVDNEAIFMLSNYRAYPLRKVKPKISSLKESVIKQCSEYMESVDFMDQKRSSTNSIIGPE